MPTLIVEANTTSVTQGSAPNAGAIAAALHAIALPAGSEGRWVGPLPRITRRGVVGGTTYISQPYQFPDNDAPRIATLSANLQRAVQTALEPLAPSSPADLLNTSTDHPRHFTVTVNYFNPTLNGRYDWWLSGHAAQTQTRDQFPGVVGSAVNPDENPNGPTLVGVNTPQGNAAALATFKPYLYLGAAAVALYFAWPVLTGARRGAGRLAGG